MRDLVQAAFEVQKLLDKQRWKYCFIGGIAVQKWGQVRITDDIDVSVLTGFGTEEKYIDQLLRLFKARIPDARSFALENRVVLLAHKDRFEIDVSCGAFPFEEFAVARAKKVQVKPGIRLKLCTAEDLIIYKAFANRPIDWLDIEAGRPHVVYCCIISNRYSRFNEHLYLLALRLSFAGSDFSLFIANRRRREKFSAP